MVEVVALESYAMQYFGRVGEHVRVAAVETVIATHAINERAADDTFVTAETCITGQQRMNTPLVCSPRPHRQNYTRRLQSMNMPLAVEPSVPPKLESPPTQSINVPLAVELGSGSWPAPKLQLPPANQYTLPRNR